MKNKMLLVLFAMIFVAYGCTSANNVANELTNQTTQKNSERNPSLKNINLPEGFEIDIFASDLGKSLFANPGPSKGVRIDMDTLQVHDFAAGWLQGNDVSGRPVDVIFDKEGVMHVSDDFSGMIYRIGYNKK